MGMEVVYTRFYKVKEIVKAAIEEDVNIVGISSYTGTHLHVLAELKRQMKENNMEVPVIIGGVIPDKDIPKLVEAGARNVITAGTPVSKSLNAILEAVGAEA